MSLGPAVAGLKDVILERLRQDETWGVQDHPHDHWAVILGEEFGEVCRAVWAWDREGTDDRNQRAELVQVAAVALAWVDAIDRDTIHTPQSL